MPRFDAHTSTSQFTQYLGPYTLQYTTEDWKGDPQKRDPGGKQILSMRARKLHALRPNTFGPEAEVVVTEAGHIKRYVDDRGISRGPVQHSKQYAS